MQDGTSYNEPELLRRLADGDEAAFRLLFDAYRDKLYTYVLQYTRSPEAAEDAVHDVFMKLWAKRKDFILVENLSAYLYRMVHNAAFSGLRRMAKETLLLAEIRGRQEDKSAAEGEDILSYQEVRSFIREIVDQMTAQQRTVFLLSRQEGLKLEEIAQRMDISLHTVKSHITAALRFLREELGKQYGSQAVILYVLFRLSQY